ncbi:ROK family protein [Streptomyces sp. NPDC005811]|uniref:ROK family protein n=1 Tax=Streptomyces sp. NPDC005811 TaxID=3154565 RepID=UPI0034084761
MQMMTFEAKPLTYPARRPPASNCTGHGAPSPCATCTDPARLTSLHFRRRSGYGPRKFGGERALLEAAQRDPSTTGREAVRAVVEAACRGDVTARAALQCIGDWHGIGVATLVNILNPRTVVFGGRLREVFLASAAHIRSRVNSHALAACRQNLRLRVGVLGDNAVLIGAAELAFSAILANPMETLAQANT